ncbi:glutathione S-transferase 1 [Ditylenchus destructor]|nr:glutathione S-transferase 1 [Ditylenchus destructor]
MASPHYKLTYFNLQGLAETSRFLFHLADVPYEDVRLDREEWMEGKKAEARWGVLPELEVDGKKLGQSKSINFYLAKKFGFAGKDEWENAKVLEFMSAPDDVFIRFRAAHWEQDPKKKQELLEVAIKESVKPYYERLEKFLEENGNGYFVGSQLTVADIHMMVMLNGIDECVAPGLVDEYEKLKSFVKRIENQPKIKEWIEKRPEAPFSFMTFKRT